MTAVQVAQSKRDLQSILASDYRGLVVSMIHKFDDIPAEINTRESIVVLVDEAHRTTGGDPEHLRAYHRSPEEEKAIRRAFLRPQEMPKILIATEKLLTGFDAPILYCMYLDKPMRDHVLLQAIARVNRPYDDEDGLVKPFGFVLDFVGIFERLEQALAFDSDTVASVIQNVDVLKGLFETMMRETATPFLPFIEGWDDKAKERALEHFEDRERREGYFKFFRQLQSLYDILSPDAFLRPFMKDYLGLAELYGLLQNIDAVYVDREFTAKTRKLLHEHTESGALQLPGAIHELGPAELAALKSSDAADTVKVLNLKKILVTTVQQQGAARPFLLSIGERAEMLAAAYEDRQMTTQQALAEFEKLAQAVVQANAKREQLGIDENTFAIYTTLEPWVKDLTVPQVKALNGLFAKYPDYQWSAAEEKHLRTALYAELRTVVAPAHLIEATKALMRLQRL